MSVKILKIKRSDAIASKSFGSGVTEFRVEESNTGKGAVIFSWEDNFRSSMPIQEAKKHIQFLQGQIKSLQDAIKYAERG